MIRIGDRIIVVDAGDQHYGEGGVVTRGEHRGVLTSRTMIEARIDGQPEQFDIGYYLPQIEVVPVLQAVA